MASGSLPPGLTLNPATGTVSGTPTTAGTYPFTVRVADATGASATQLTSIAIAAGPLVVVKSADVSTVVAGGTVRYTVTVSNTGAGSFAGINVSDPLAGVLDDAAYNNDAAATTGVASVTGGTLTWTGTLAAGATATITYSVTVSSPDNGNHLLANTVSSSTLGTNCASGSADARCAVSVAVAALTIVKTADLSTASPGQTIHYSVTLVNAGQAAYPVAAFTDSLAGILDDAVYNGDGAASAGVVSFAGSTLSWTGAVSVGGSVTVTYSVTVSSPDAGDRGLSNTVVSAAAGNNCTSGSGDARCTISVTVLAQSLTLTIAASASTSSPGASLGYTVTIANTGQTVYNGTSVDIALAQVLDHATYNGDATATAGAVALAAQTLTWTGTLAPGATVSVTFSVTLLPVPVGDNVVTATLISAAPANNCRAGGSDPRCAATTTVLVPGLTIVKTANRAAVTPAAVVGYTVTVTDTGQTPYPAANLVDSLAGVLDDATYNGDAAATSGAVAVASGTLTWTGALAVGATATITYSVTVVDPAVGDRSMHNVAVSTSAGSNCPAGGTDPRCTAVVTVQQPRLTITNHASTPTTTPGSTETFTVTIVNAGESAYTGTSVSESLVDMLDDAVFNGDATATSGTVTFASSTLTWTGNLAVGASVTVAFTVTVHDPDTGSRVLAATLVSAAAGSSCPAGGTDPACSVSVTVLVPGLVLTKTADVATTTPGASVNYTIVATNTGETAYVGTTFTDSLSNVLNDAVYNADAVASAGSVSFASSTLTWTGDLAVGAAVTLTYSVTVENPDPGDKTMVDTVVSPAPGNNCPAGGSDPRCTATVLVLVPGLTIATTAPATTVPGGVVAFSTTVTNSGATTQTGVSVTLSLAGLLDEATYDANASATVGSVTFVTPNLVWTGTLAPGAAVTVTYSATVHNPVGGDLLLTVVATSAAVGSNCPAGSPCTTTVAVARLVIDTSTDVATVLPGGVIRVNATYTNTGTVPYSGISVLFNSVGFADDVSSNGDETVSSGTLTIGDTGAVWTGDIPVGATVTLTGTATVLNPDTGNHVITGISSSTAPGNNCASGSLDPLCTVTVHVLEPGLTITKEADSTTVVPGDTVGYTITIHNSGTAPYTGLALTDPLAGVLDDATFNDDAAASAGLVAFTTPTLTWTGDLGTGDTVTVTYSVTVRTPEPGDKTMANTVTSSAPGSPCTATSHVSACSATVFVLTPGLTISKAANLETAIPGTVITYTLTIRNSGQTPYTAISVADDLAGVLDDGTYNADAAPSAGTLSYSAPVLTWTGSVAVGASVTVTYTATVDNPDLGNASLVNAASSTVDGNNCPGGSADPRCTVTVPVVDVTTLTFTKTANSLVTTNGSVLRYTITVANSGLSTYPGAQFTDSLSDVLKDAAYNNDATSSSVDEPDYTEPVLSWTGDVPATGTVSITYSVTIGHTTDSDHSLTNTVVSTSSGGNCAAASGDARCTVTVPVAELAMSNTANVTTVLPGGSLELTATFTNTGGIAYFGTVVNLGGLNLLDDADPNGPQFVSSGTTVVTPTSLEWTGDIPIGATVTVRGGFTVHDPDLGNKVLESTITSSAVGSDCPVLTPQASCTVTVPVLTPALTITKVADTPFAVPGQTVGYTVTVTNDGDAPYTAAVVTDALSGALDDATFGDQPEATIGTAVFAGSTLTWTGDLPVGTAAIITYSMTVRTPDPGDKVIVDRLSSLASGSTCPPASANPDCAVQVPVLVPALSLSTTAGAGSTTPGGSVSYTVTIVNSGQTLQDAVTVSEDLTGVLDDASYAGGAAASTGEVTFSSPDLVWTGTLAPGTTATVTFTVTVANPDAGNRILTAAVSSAAPGSTCAPGATVPPCSVTVTVSQLQIVNSADTANTRPGAIVRFTTTVTNAGQTPYTDITVSASFVGALDDGVYNGDATASSGNLVLVTGTGVVRWTGDLAVGAVLTVSGTFTVRDPDPGNKVMTSVVSSAVPGNNCPVGGTDPACTATVTVLVPALSMVKTADRATAAPGTSIGYTITVTNTGQTPYIGAVVTDSLAGLLAHAAYGDDAVASSGEVSYGAPVLTWSGDLAVAAQVTITYSATVNAADVSGALLTNTVTSSEPGSTCPAGNASPACTASVVILVPALHITKRASTATTTPGSTLTYTITIANTGQSPYAAAMVTDSLTDVLDDAAYNSDATASTGALAYLAPVLTWTGDLAVGATTTVTYTVTAHTPATGDHDLSNTAVSTMAGSNCPPAGTDADCTATVTLLIPALTITNVADVTTTTPGGVVRFTAEFTNSGPTPYAGISIVTDAADVFDDARPNGDEVASAGTLSVVGNAVTWTGDIPIGGTVTVTGTVTVLDPDPGDHVMTSTITTQAPGSNCAPTAPGPACSILVTILTPALAIVKTADAPTTTPGGVVTYTITATNNGETVYQGATITDSLAALLPDAAYGDDATASTGVVNYSAPVLTWTGDIPLGATLTISYSVTVGADRTPGRVLSNTTVSTVQANNCAPGSLDPGCTVSVPILIPALIITKAASTATVTAGQGVAYTLVVVNTGQIPYLGATVSDPLSGILDDAVYDDNATASIGDVSFADGTLSWTGDLAIGASATITYSVTTVFPDSGDHELANTVTSTASGASCAPGSVGPACTATVTVLIPQLTIVKTTDAGTVVAGGVVHYTITVTNTGQAALAGAGITDSLVGVLGKATFDSDATATLGTLSYAPPLLTWTGDLDVDDTAIISYSVTTAPGDAEADQLVNQVRSATLGANCTQGATDPRCSATVVIAAQVIALTSLPTAFTVSGIPGETSTAEGAVTMTVITNSPTGYSVSVRATTDQLVSAGNGSTDTIPIEDLRVRETGTQAFTPLSTGATVTVHGQSGPSAPGGDAISNDFQATIPFVTTGTYSATLEYIATTQ